MQLLFRTRPAPLPRCPQAPTLDAMVSSKVAVMLMLTLCGSAFASRHLTEATEKGARGR